MIFEQTLHRITPLPSQPCGVTRILSAPTFSVIVTLAYKRPFCCAISASKRDPSSEVQAISENRRELPKNCGYNATSSAPAVTKKIPSQFIVESRSPRNATPNTATRTTLNLSIGATCAALPSLSARK